MVWYNSVANCTQNCWALPWSHTRCCTQMRPDKFCALHSACLINAPKITTATVMVNAGSLSVQVGFDKHTKHTQCKVWCTT
jgi:hypothetical protein